MIVINSKTECAGCSACVITCPKHCISWNTDNEGFKYPKVDDSICVDCHLCEKVCPISNHKDGGSDKVEQYAAYALDEYIRKESSSGGIFSIISNYIIELGGCIYGAAFDDHFKLEHICVEKEDDLKLLRGSKYLQSDMNDIFFDVKSKLAQGRKVLFSGSPCQVNGLLNYVGDNKNLLTIDFVCHGVPSPLIFTKYLDSFNDNKISQISFRNKKYGWKTFSVAIDYKNATRYSKILTHDKYMQMFLRNIILRPSCYECKQKHRSDITLADYWDISKQHPNLNDDKGISKVLINTGKGKNVWQAISKNVKSVSDGYIKPIHQGNRTIPKNREALFNSANDYSFDELYDKYVKKGIVYEFGNILKGYTKIILHKLHLYNIG